MCQITWSATWVFYWIAYKYWKNVRKPTESALRTTGGALRPDSRWSENDKTGGLEGWKKDFKKPEYWGENPAVTRYSDHSDKTLTLKGLLIMVLLPWCQPMECVSDFTQKLAVNTSAYPDCIVLTSDLHHFFKTIMSKIQLDLGSCCCSGWCACCHLAANRGKAHPPNTQEQQTKLKGHVTETRAGRSRKDSDPMCHHLDQHVHSAEWFLNL